jgi:hypothetical protein
MWDMKTLKLREDLPGHADEVFLCEISDYCSSVLIRIVGRGQVDLFSQTLEYLGTALLRNLSGFDLGMTTITLDVQIQQPSILLRFVSCTTLEPIYHISSGISTLSQKSVLGSYGRQKIHWEEVLVDRCLPWIGVRMVRKWPLEARIVC